MSGKHAKLAPSGASRWMKCPGCIRLESKCPQVDQGPYAPEGTAGHELCEKCLLKWRLPDEFEGKFINGFEVNDEMIEAAEVYLDFIWGIASRAKIKAKTHEMYVEKRFKLTSIHKDIWGTSDCTILARPEKALHVIDFKYGKGVEVSPEYNPQAMIYALGAIQFLQSPDIEKVQIAIIQPRIDPSPKVWEIDPAELSQWGHSELKDAAIRTEDPNAPLIAGDHCRFCRAIAVCPAHIERACEIAKTDFANPVLPEADQLTPADIAKVLQVSKQFNAWAGSVKAYALSLMLSGIDIPGYKLVEKRAMRRWRKADNVADQLHLLLGENAYKKSLVTVAAAERVCKKEGIDKKELEDLWEKPDAGVGIAPDTDKREAVIKTASEDFEDDLFLT